MKATELSMHRNSTNKDVRFIAAVGDANENDEADLFWNDDGDELAEPPSDGSKMGGRNVEVLEPQQEEPQAL